MGRGFTLGRARSPLRTERAMTLVELTIALAILTVAVGCLIQVLSAVSSGQGTLWHRQQALHTARDIAEDVIAEQADWQGLCSTYDARPDADVAVENGDGNPMSGWHQITVRVRAGSFSGQPEQEVALVFGKVD